MPELVPAAPSASESPPPPRAARRRLTRWLKGLALAVGIGLLVLMVRRAGPALVLRQMLGLGPWFLVVLLVSSSWFVMNTWGWWQTFDPRPRSFWRLLRVHLVSEAVSNITPFLALGGEPLKVMMLREELGGSAVTAAVVNDNLVHVVSAVAFMVVGLGCGLLLFDLDAQLLAVLLGGIVGFALLSGALLFGGSKGALGRLLRQLRRLRIPLPGASPEVWQERAETVDRQIADFLGRRRRDFLLCLLGHLGGRLLGAVEAWVVLYALGHPVSLATAVFIIAIIHVLVNLVFSVIPSQLGVQEAVAYLLFQLIGLDPAAAVVLALVRRIRSFVWIGVGLALGGVSGGGSPAASEAKGL